MPEIETNYALILAHEQQLANRVASIVMEKPQISVWMFLFPFVLIPFMQRLQQYQGSLGLFSQGYLFTKTLAMDTARKVSAEGRSREEAIADAAVLINRAAHAPQQASDSGYSDYKQRVRDKQIAEIELLTEHYASLLNATGSTYPALVTNAYRSAENYNRFLTRLHEAEAQVNQASIRAYSAEVENLPNIIAKTEKALTTIRAKTGTGYFWG
ncbi:MAG: NF038143 family protein [Eubacteriales bacterium]|nr:NF038143 family protein [Bacillota bacterium]MBV1727687.1 NF038143 family protein [Desulforudis sp.]MDP3050261.1 NF038143 family protein [Eubacteriales bacterium]MBU4532749.1 NF038143 family protein [Bacillota bacterium]MBV1736258.1 NF038143 family protein [Desulforudis sp.]